MKKIVCLVLMILFILCTGCTVVDKTPISIEPLSETEITEYFKDPSKFTGRIISLSGEITKDPEPFNKDMLFTIKSEKHDNILINTKLTSPAKVGDEIHLYGFINPAYSELENVQEETIIPSIQGVETEIIDSQTKLSTIETNVSQIKNDITMTIKKIEFLPEKTKVAAIIKNQSSGPIYFFEESWQIRQNNIDMNSIEHPEINSSHFYYLYEGEEKEYTISFEPIEAGDFKLKITHTDGEYSDETYSFDFSVKGANKV